ncbi:hypothetical protein WMY93_016319 [Mugilogobius chulae]
MLLSDDCTMLMAESVFGAVLVSNMLRLMSCERWLMRAVVSQCGQTFAMDSAYCAHLNAQRYRDEILKPIVAAFVELHHVTFQQDNARPHMAGICRDFLEDEDIPVLNWPPYSPDMSPSEKLGCSG